MDPRSQEASRLRKAALSHYEEGLKYSDHAMRVDLNNPGEVRALGSTEIIPRTESIECFRFSFWSDFIGMEFDKARDVQENVLKRHREMVLNGIAELCKLVSNILDLSGPCSKPGKESDIVLS